MKFEAIVKVVNEVKEGVSQASGNNYKYQSIILETPDGEGVARLLVSLGTKQVDEMQSQDIQVGNRVVVDLTFTTYITRANYVENRIYVNEIAKIV